MEQYDRGNGVPSTWKQKSSLDNNGMFGLQNLTFSKTWGVLGAQCIGINSNKWTSCQISPLDYIPQLKNPMSTLSHLSLSQHHSGTQTTTLCDRQGAGEAHPEVSQPDPLCWLQSTLTKMKTERNPDQALNLRFWTFLCRKHPSFRSLEESPRETGWLMRQASKPE